MSNSEKLKALKLTIDKIDKDFGKGSVMMMNERGEQTQEVISTGSIGLDAALGIGGLPRGRVVEIYGPESSGKTTVATHVIAEAQKRAACAPLSTPSMLLILPMRKSWVWTSTTC
jgi:recombination protein RecA